MSDADSGSGEVALYFVVSPKDTGVADSKTVCPGCVDPFREDGRFRVSSHSGGFFAEYGCDGGIGCGRVINNPGVGEEPDVNPLPELKITRRDPDSTTAGTDRVVDSRPSRAWEDHR